MNKWMNKEDVVCVHTHTYTQWNIQFSSVQFSRSGMSDSLQSHGLQHARPPRLSPTPGVYPNSCALSRWCHPTIPSSVFSFSSCPQSFPASGSFQMNQLFASGGQIIRTLRTDSFSMDWLNLLAVQGTLKSLLQHHSSKLVGRFFIHWATWEAHARFELITVKSCR